MHFTLVISTKMGELTKKKFGIKLRNQRTESDSHPPDIEVVFQAAQCLSPE